MDSSRSGSLGEWIRFMPHGSRSPRRAVSVSSASSTRGRTRPAEPKNPIIPCSAMAMTKSVVAMPLAMAPAMYAKRVPCTSLNPRSPSHSG
jgi:hypothetical protein